MAKLRVYELAKKLGVENKDILTALENAGMAAKSHSSGLEDEQLTLIYSKFPAGAAGEAAGSAAKTKKTAPRPTFRPAGIMRGIKPATPQDTDEEMPAIPVAAKRAPAKVDLTEKEAVQKRQESYESKMKGAAEVVLKTPESILQHEAQEEAAHAAVSAPEEAPVASEPQPAEQAFTEAPVAEEAAATSAAPAETVPSEPTAAAIEAPEEKAPVSVTGAVEKPEAPGVKAGMPGAPSVAGQPPRPEPRPVVAAKPDESGDKRFKKKGAPVVVEEDVLLKKKPKPKGPKPVRPEFEVLEGVDRVPVIPAKLKERLQPVKKQMVESQVVQEGAGKKVPKWTTMKGAGKKKGKFKNMQMMPMGVDEQAGTVARKKAVKITEGMSIKDFSDRIGRKSGEVLKKLIEMGTMATINQSIDPDAAVLIADSFGLKVEITPITDEEAFVEEVEDREEQLIHRPPVVTIMGHVDHGKTSLLDAIRNANVTAGEAGGITQHIGAYKVALEDKEIVFLDTPGHEAFTAMRARGAQITDIVVLVVAADDGVKPQTIEAINHSKAAGVPIIVAVNKVDKPDADIDKVKRELTDQGLMPEEWGGETIFVPVSAKKKTGLESLLEMILLQAEVMELKANPDKMGRGTIVEAKLDRGRGPVATVLVSTGTIRVGDAFVTGQHHGRIRMLLNDKGKKVKEATPATPVEIIGLSGVPSAGDAFVVMEDEKKARMVAQTRMQKQREVELSLRKRVSLEDLFSQIQQGEVKELNIIIKADVQGSAEAVADSLAKLSTDQVKLNTIHASVGAITESDIMLASASNAIVIGFNIRPEPKAAALAEAEAVDVRMYNIIYNAIDEVKAAMEGLLEPTFKEKVTGRAEVRDTFTVPKIGTIAGSYVTDGTIGRNCAGVRVIRDNVVIFEGKLGSLKRFKDDVKEVLTGYECGIGVANFNDIKVGDVIEAYIIEEFASKL